MKYKNNKKILEYKKIIEEQKKKIKLEKKAIRKKRREDFRKSKFGRSKIGRFLCKIFFVFDEKDNYSFSELMVTTLVSLILGFFTCFSVFTIISGGRNYLSVMKDFGKFYDVYHVLTSNYSGSVDKEKLIDEAINGMVSSVGDVYTTYNDATKTNEFDEMVSGTYQGIGCTIKQDEDKVVVVEVYDGSPASKAGIKADDIIKSVDGKDASELKIEGVSNYVKNEATGVIEIILIREDKEINVKLERGKVELPSVVSKTFMQNDKKIGYLGISIFSSVTAKQFTKELDKLEKDGIKSLVIDVRGNNGGYLTTVSEIASSLLPKGKVIYQVEANKKIKVTKDKTAENREYPIAILVNGGSASASEILAGVIKESYKGYVVGTKTYGKGTVQQVRKLDDGSMIKYTIENWLTPNGNWINDSGIEPTDLVELDEKYFEEPNDENDNQLQKALELVSK